MVSVHEKGSDGSALMVLRKSQLLPPFIHGQPSEGRQPKYERRAIDGKKAKASADSRRCWLTCGEPSEGRRQRHQRKVIAAFLITLISK
jgi:hypothetical protein